MEKYTEGKKTIKEILQISKLKDEYLETGLTTKEVIRNRHVYGSNSFTCSKKNSSLESLIKIYVQPFNILLLLASILSFVVYSLNRTEMENFYLGVFILLISFLNTCIEFYQEYKSAEILENFKKMISNESVVRRNGTIEIINSDKIVVSDLIYFKTGDKINADIKLISTNDLQVDHSSLTGESIPQKKNTEPCKEDYLHSKNLIHSGDLVLNGRGEGIVIYIGNDTALGHIAKLTTDNKEAKSELSKEIDQFVKKMGFIALLVSIVFYGIALLNGRKIKENFIFCIGIFIAFVPQGLPATITALMMITVKRLAKKNVLVKDLRAVETLGSISLLATDKTGTLTQGIMKCVSFWDGENVSNVERLENPLEISESVGMAAQICSYTSIKLSKSRKIIGNPTEVALSKFGEIYYSDDHSDLVYELPFDSTRKYQLCIFDKNDEQYYVCIKGAPERIFDFTSKHYENSEAKIISEHFRINFQKKYEEFAEEGQRVIGLAHTWVKKSELDKKININNVLNMDMMDASYFSFTFVGLIGIYDPPKKGVKDAIMKLRLAGIKVVMVTGDHQLTAENIARRINILSGTTRDQIAKQENRSIKDIQRCEYESEIIAGDQIDMLKNSDWKEIMSKDELIFARTSPEQKLIIVEKFQEYGHIVGVSGDGVNDSPALKKAHLGISMNLTGSDVSKEAASMILLDDNFCTIVDGVAEGRLVFANMKKSLRYILTHISPQVIPFLIYVSFGIPLPMSTILLMLIDLFTEFFTAVGFAFESPEGNLMFEAPRKYKGNDDYENSNYLKNNLENHQKFEIFNYKKKVYNETLCDKDLIFWSYIEGGLIVTIGCLLSFFTVLYKQGIPFEYFFFSSIHFFKKDAETIYVNENLQFNANNQLEILMRAQSVYFYSIIICQGFNMLTCKRKNRSISIESFNNPFPIIGTIFGLLFGYCITHLRIFNRLLGSRPFTFNEILPAIGFGTFLLFWNAIRIQFKKKFSFFGNKRDIDLLCRLRKSDKKNDHIQYL